MTARSRCTMPLAEAAFELKVPYARAYDMLLVGKLRGMKIAGRWMIDPASVRRLAGSAEESAQDGAPAS